METVTMRVGERDILVRGMHARKLSESRIFRRWIRAMKPNGGLETITELWSRAEIQGEIRFALFSLEYRTSEGKLRPWITFFRPDAVAVLVVIHEKETGKRYAVIVEQLRVPTGKKLFEIPAGTIEDEGDPEETAVREIEEETGFVITKEDLSVLGTYYLSPGACPERITLYACELERSKEEIRQLQDSKWGLHEHGEYISLHLIKFEDVPKRVEDAKSLLAYFLFQIQKIRPSS